ncbi:MAG: flagellar filament capping protein FliD [bacterium]|nr:flagellar filament capping protein FliD [bacterium]
MGIRVGGLSSGLDTEALISAFIAYERRPLDLVERNKAEVQSQKSLFKDLNTKLQALRDASAAIDNQNSLLTGATLNEELLEFKVGSSKESVLTGTATGDATPGTIDVQVDQLATVGRRFSAAFSSDTTTIANSGETLTIDYGGTSNIAITVGASGASLRDLKDAINTDANNQGNVNADILFDGTNYRLIISGDNTGAANDVSATTTISGPGASPFVDSALDQTAQDSQVTVYGNITINRSGNDITDAIPGLSLKLHAADPGVPVTLDIQRDDEKLTEKFQTLVDAYNGVVDFINAQSKFDEETKQAGPLSGNPTLRGIQFALQTALQGSSENPYAFTDNPIRSIGEFGIEIGTDGRLSLDATEMTQKLDEDPFAVRQFLAGLGTGDAADDGMATAMARAIDDFVLSGTGILANIDSSLDTRIANFDVQIERFEERLEKREELLVLQFARLESSIAALQGQGNSLSSLLVINS